MCRAGIVAACMCAQDGCCACVCTPHVGVRMWLCAVGACSLHSICSRYQSSQSSFSALSWCLFLSLCLLGAITVMSLQFFNPATRVHTVSVGGQQQHFRLSEGSGVRWEKVDKKQQQQQKKPQEQHKGPGAAAAAAGGPAQQQQKTPVARAEPKVKKICHQAG